MVGLVDVHWGCDLDFDHVAISPPTSVIRGNPRLYEENSLWEALFKFCCITVVIPHSPGVDFTEARADPGAPGGTGRAAAALRQRAPHLHGGAAALRRRGGGGLEAL